MKNVRFDIIIQLELWILLTFDKSSCQFFNLKDLEEEEMVNIETEVVSVNFTINLHKKDEYAYIHSPLQGICASSELEPNGFLTLQFFSYEKRLMWQYEMPGGLIHAERDMKHALVKEVEVLWSSGGNTSRPGIFYKFCVRGYVHMVCRYTNDEQGSGEEDSCYEAHVLKSLFRPMKPLLFVKQHLPLKVFIENEQMEVYCVAVVGTTGDPDYPEGNLTLTLFNSKGASLISWTAFYTRDGPHKHVEGEGYPGDFFFERKVMEDRGPVYGALLQLPVHSNIQKRHFTCTVSNTLDRLRTKSEKYSGIDIPYKPVLRATSNIFNASSDDGVWNLEGSCYSLNGSLTGLAFIFTSSEQTTVYMPDREDATKAYTVRTFANDKFSGETQLIRKNFWTVYYGGALQLKMNAELQPRSEPILLSCRVWDLQVCKRYSPTIARPSRKKSKSREEKDYTKYLFYAAVTEMVFMVMLFLIALQFYLDSRNKSLFY